MKKTFLLLSTITLLFSACQKQSDKLTPALTTNNTKASTAETGPVVMVDTINRYVLDIHAAYVPYYYQTTFTYDGKQLQSSYSGIIQQLSGESATSVRTYFYYNDASQLTNTSINIAHYGPETPEDITRADVTYTGSHIGTIEFFSFAGVSDKKFSLTYTNDRLTEIFEPNTVKISYEYDAAGNNTREINQRYMNGAPYLTAVVTDKSAFDDKHNFQKALPLWVYFKCYDIEMNKPDVGLNFTVLQKSFTNTPGNNNPLNLNTGGVPSAFTYKYFDNGYPFQICDLEYIWHYSYTTVQ